MGLLSLSLGAPAEAAIPVDLAATQHVNAVLEMQQKIAMENQWMDRERARERELERQRREMAMSFQVSNKMRRVGGMTRYVPPPKTRYVVRRKAGGTTGGFNRHFVGVGDAHTVNFGSISSPTPNRGFGEFNSGFNNLREGGGTFRFGFSEN